MIFLTGMFGSEKPLKSNPSLVKKDSFGVQYFFVSYRVYGHDSLTNKREKSPSKMLQIEDEEEAYHYDIQKEKLFGLATIFKGVMILPYFFSHHLL